MPFSLNFLAIVQAVSLSWNTLPCPYLAIECLTYASQLSPFLRSPLRPLKIQSDLPFMCTHRTFCLFPKSSLTHCMEDIFLSNWNVSTFVLDMNSAHYGSPVLGSSLAQRSLPMHFVAYLKNGNFRVGYC